MAKTNKVSAPAVKKAKHENLKTDECQKPKVAREIHRIHKRVRQRVLPHRTCRCFGGARFVYASGQRPSRSLHCDASYTNDIRHISSDTPTASDTQTCTHRQLHVQHRLAHSPALASPFRLAPTSSRSWHARRIACAPTAPHQTTTFNAATHRIHVLSHGRKGKQCAFHSSCFWAAAAAEARQSQRTLAHGSGAHAHIEQTDTATPPHHEPAGKRRRHHEPLQSGSW
jgi:hypothetical protein